MNKAETRFETRLARSVEDIRGAQRLRYEVFVEELGASGADVDHQARLETDRFDEVSDHLLLIDRLSETGPRVVGVYRMMDRAQAERAGRFYSASEYDLSPLIASGRPLLEVGRSCVHKDFRGGSSMYLLWNALAGHVVRNGIQILFGVASVHGTDPTTVAHALSYLHAHHLAPADLRARSLAYQPMNLLPEDQVDRVEAMKETPALIKAYLKLGGFVGDGAYIDRDFNTIDVFVAMDRARMSQRVREIYERKASR